jgi:hypothetical protein
MQKLHKRAAERQLILQHPIIQNVRDKRNGNARKRRLMIWNARTHAECRGNINEKMPISNQIETNLAFWSKLERPGSSSCVAAGFPLRLESLGSKCWSKFEAWACTFPRRQQHSIDEWGVRGAQTEEAKKFTLSPWDMAKNGRRRKKAYRRTCIGASFTLLMLTRGKELDRGADRHQWHANPLALPK